MIGDITEWAANPSSRPNFLGKAIRTFLILIRLPFRESKRALVLTARWAKRILRPIFGHVRRTVRNKNPLRGVKRSMSMMTRGLNRKQVAQTSPEDLEIGKGHGTNGEKALCKDLEDVDRVVEEFRLAVAKTFETSMIVDDFDYCVQRWKGKRCAKYHASFVRSHRADKRLVTSVHSFPAFGLDIRMKHMLWGYPSLLRLFTENVLPVLQAAEQEGLQHYFQDPALPTPASSLHLSSGVIADAILNPLMSVPSIEVDAAYDGGEGDGPSPRRAEPLSENVHRGGLSSQILAQDHERRRVTLGPASIGRDLGALADAGEERAPNCAPDSGRFDRETGIEERGSAQSSASGDRGVLHGNDLPSPGVTARQ